MPSGWPVQPSTNLCLRSATLSSGPMSSSGDAVPHTPRGLVADRVCLPPEMEHSTCPGWKAYSNQLSTRRRKPLPQLQGLPLYIVLLALVDGDYKSAGTAGLSSNFPALQFEVQIGSIGFPDSDSLGIGGPKVNVFILEDDAFPSSSV